MSVAAISSALSGIAGGGAPTLGRVLGSIGAKQIAPVPRIVGREDGRPPRVADEDVDLVAEDTVELSPEALEAAEAAEAESKQRGSEELTEEEWAQVEELNARDREVRQHEQAHLSATGEARGDGVLDQRFGGESQSNAMLIDVYA